MTLLSPGLNRCLRNRGFRFAPGRSSPSRRREQQPRAVGRLNLSARVLQSAFLSPRDSRVSAVEMELLSLAPVGEPDSPNPVITAFLVLPGRPDLSAPVPRRKGSLLHAVDVGVLGLLLLRRPEVRGQAVRDEIPIALHHTLDAPLQVAVIVSQVAHFITEGHRLGLCGPRIREGESTIVPGGGATGETSTQCHEQRKTLTDHMCKASNLVMRYIGSSCALFLIASAMMTVPRLVRASSL